MDNNVIIVEFLKSEVTCQMAGIFPMQMDSSQSMARTNIIPIHLTSLNTLLTAVNRFGSFTIIEPLRAIPRPYHTQEDYWYIREFLRDVSLHNNRRDFSWSLLRWDYWRWHVNENIFHFNLQDVITVWKLNRQIVAMVNPDGEGEAFFQIHPRVSKRNLRV